jgi:predicted NUDIX family phosphoesterase
LKYLRLPLASTDKLSWFNDWHLRAECSIRLNATLRCEAFATKLECVIQGALTWTEWFVGLFTKAAYEVLKQEMRPLTAVEITNIALRDGYLHTLGKTPSQTMKSKLSTDILRRAASSLFMRVAEGRFSLREWKDRYPEHVANRYQKALFDEDIVVFPSKSLKKFVPVVGLYSGPLKRDDLLIQCRPMRRREAEEDTSVIQLVSVFIVRFEDRYLTYKRTRRLPENRLHGFYSLGFGGHLNPDDLKPLLNIFDPDVAAPLLLRELGEELRLDPRRPPKLTYRGLLYDDSRPVSKQHLGITYDVFLDSDQFEIGERGFLMDAKFETLDQIAARQEAFENWSWILIREEQEEKHWQQNQA